MTQEEIQTTLLKLLKVSGAIHLGELVSPNANEQIRRAVRARTGVDFEVEWSAINEALWSLIVRRLAWVATYERNPNAWYVSLTERGKAAAQGESVNPDDPSGYLKKLLRDAPETSEVVQLYLRESLNSFEQECYLASAVMLGVAAEACMLDTADVFVNWNGSPAEKLKEILENPRTFYVVKLEAFQKSLAAAKGSLPPELSDNLDLDVNAVIQLIRQTRNEAGHPTGRRIDREDAFNHLIIYARANKRLYGLMTFFKNGANQPP
jgi:hypothetical protein